MSGNYFLWLALSWLMLTSFVAATFLCANLALSWCLAALLVVLPGCEIGNGIITHPRNTVYGLWLYALVPFVFAASPAERKEEEEVWHQQQSNERSLLVKHYLTNRSPAPGTEAVGYMKADLVHRGRYILKVFFFFFFYYTFDRWGFVVAEWGASPEMVLGAKHSRKMRGFYFSTTLLV